MAATLDLHKTLAALRPDPPPRPLRIMLIATSSKLGGLAVTGAQNFYDVTTAGAEAVGQPWSQPVEGWHKEFYTAANVTANGHAYGPLALEGVLRKQLDELSPKVTLRMDYDLTGVRLDDKGSLASVSIKQVGVRLRVGRLRGGTKKGTTDTYSIADAGAVADGDALQIRPRGICRCMGCTVPPITPNRTAWCGTAAAHARTDARVESGGPQAQGV